AFLTWLDGFSERRLVIAEGAKTEVYERGCAEQSPKDERGWDDGEGQVVAHGGFILHRVSNPRDVKQILCSPRGGVSVADQPAPSPRGVCRSYVTACRARRGVPVVSGRPAIPRGALR